MPRSSRTVIVLGLMALLCAAASVALAASHFHPHHAEPRALKVACAQKRGGLLRYVTSTARCRRTERPVNFAQDAPVYACVRPDAANGIAHAAARDARGTVRRMSGPGRCGRDVQVVLPGLGPRSFCVDAGTHLLRNLLGGTPCHRRGEFKVILAKRRHRTAPAPQPAPAPAPPPAAPGNHAPTAAADAVTVGEDSTALIAALANDADADGDPIHIAGLGTAGTRGHAAMAPGGKIAYDPQGAFESLGEGDSASDSFTYRVSDGTGESAPATVSVTVKGADDLPVAQDDSATTGEDAVRTLHVLDNDADADGEALHVTGLDTTGTTGSVTVNLDGTIDYDPSGAFDALRPAEQATDSFTYRATDAHGSSAAATVFLTITGSNDAPVLSGVESSPLAYDTGSAATAITSTLALGDVDSTTITGATVTIASGHVAARDSLSFAAQNGISSSWDAATGVLTLTGSAPKADYEAALRAVTFEATDPAPSGSRRIDFTVSDGTDSSATASRDITVTHVNQAPTASADAYSGAYGNTTLAVGTTPSGPHTTVTGDVLANDSDADNGHAALTATATSPTASGAKVSMNSDGTFTYVPPAGLTGDDSFQYTVHDNDPDDPRTATGTVTVTVGGPMTWYIDAGAAAGGDGRSDAPFTSLTPLSTGGSADAKDGANDRIFVYRNATADGAGIVLETGQKLIGQSQGLTAGATTLVAAAGANPAIAPTGAPAVTLASGADVQGVDMSAGGAPAVSGTGISTATIGSSSAITGSGGGVALDGGSGSVTIGAPITTTGGHSVSVQNRAGGTVALLGAIRDTGAGIQLRSNTGATVSFGGKLTASTGASPAFSAAGGGTVVAVAAGSTLASTTGTALDVRSDTIGASGLKFQSVSANGAANGILLSSTGSSGGLTVSGTGGAGSGGTIQSATGHAVSLSATRNVALNNLLIQSPQHAGVKGTNVHGFSLTNSTISGAGAALSDPADASLAFNDTSGASDVNLDGAVTITGNTLSGAYGGGIDVDNYAGTISNAVISNNTISSSTSTAASRGNGIALNLFGTGSTVASLTRATIASNSVTNFPSGDGIAVQGANTSGAGAPAGSYGVPNGSSPGTGANIIDISNNQVAGDAVTHLNGSAISASVTGVGQGNFSIRNNGTAGSPLRNTKAEAIATGAAGNVTANFDVAGNHVNADNTLGSSGVSLGTDRNVQADSSTLATPVVNAQFLSNDIAGSSGAGLRVLTRDSNGMTRVRVAGNTIANPAQGGTPGIRMDAGSSGSATYNPTVCADITGNVAGTGPADGFGNVAPGILLYKRSASASTYQFGLDGLSPSPAGPAAVEAFVSAADLGSATGAGTWAGKRVAVGSGDQFTSCTLPF